jgi:hypothetical protein
MEQLDDTLVILKSGDKEIVLDPGEKMCPFQTVSWRHSAATGVRQSPDGRALFPLPFSPTPTTRPFVVSTPIQSYTDNKTVRNSDLTVDQHGGVTGSINIVMTGQQALHWRQQALRNDSEEVKKQFDHQLESIVPEGVEAKLDHFLGIDDPDVKLIALVKVRGSLGTATSKRLLLPGSFFDTRGHQPFVNQEKRLESVDMKYGNQVSDQVTYYLPAGMTVEGAPKDDKIAWPQHSVYITKSKSEPGKITIANVLSVAFTFAKAEEYQDLRGFYQKVDAANQAQLVLANASPAAVAAPAAASDSVISVVPEPAVDPKGH